MQAGRGAYHPALLTILCDDPGHFLGCWGIALDLIAYYQPIHL
jgi:hypothetical protein